MKRLVKYAILQYVLSLERDEKINIGVVLHSPKDRFMELKVINNWRRLKEFDDEIDIEFMKSYIKTLKEYFEYNPLNNNYDIDDENILDKMTQYYINQIIFKISEVCIDLSCNEFLEKLKNNYLYFDIEKN